MARKTEYTEYVRARVSEEQKKILTEYSEKLNIGNESEFLRIVLRAFGHRPWNEVRDFLYPADTDEEEHSRQLMAA